MRLLKFDGLHPRNYLNIKKHEWGSNLDLWSKEEYYQKLISLRMNFSDFYTYYFNSIGWTAEEFFPADKHYIAKVEKELYRNYRYFNNKIDSIKRKLGLNGLSKKMLIIEDYIEKFHPDVIFCREHTGIPSSFWKKYRNRTLIVARLSAGLPADWSPLDFDIIYTDIPLYKDFFSVNGVLCRENNNGFDERILNEIRENGKKYDISFVGGLGNQGFSKRTTLMEKVAEYFGDSFYWWGYKSGSVGEHLEKRYQGVAAGINMFQIYKDSTVVINDYIDLAGNTAVNQRMYEILGVGTLMLTRDSESLWQKFPRNSIPVFEDYEECIEKIKYFLSNPDKSSNVAMLLQKFTIENFSYKKMVSTLSDELISAYQNKFQKNQL